MFLQKSLLTEVTALSQTMIHFFQIFSICSSWHFMFMCSLHLFLFFNFQCNRFWHFCYIFFVLVVFFLFLRTCCFWILFFPFILLLTMIPGANTKKSADDITSNDRGEDEGIFCFFKAQPWCMNINFLIFIIIIIVTVIAIISTWFLVPYLQKHTSVCFFIFFFRNYFHCFSF